MFVSLFSGVSLKIYTSAEYEHGTQKKNDTDDNK